MLSYVDLLNRSSTEMNTIWEPIIEKAKSNCFWSSVSSTEKDIDMRLTKAWTAIDRLSIIWKSDLTDKMKRSFFQAGVVSILLYGCTTWTQTKRLEKRLDGNYTRMLQGTNYTATYLPSRKLSKLDEPDTQDTAGEVRMSS